MSAEEAKQRARDDAERKRVAEIAAAEDAAWRAVADATHAWFEKMEREGVVVPPEPHP
jgi:hypothetical protein